MKHLTKITFLLMVTAIVSSATGLKAQESTKGIQFFHGTFAEAQAKAKKENKLIFMDAMTSWCGPCKWMASNTFTDESVGEYYNAHFVNLKVDMEKGEGVELGRRFSVMAYPTLLFLDGEGTVKSRTMGAKPASEFIALGQKAVKAN